MESGEKDGQWKTVAKFKGTKRRSIKWEKLVSVFVNNLPELTVADQLRLAFSPAGKVYDAFIPASSRRGRGCCFGFVGFENLGTATKAVTMMNGKRFAGRLLEVNVARFGWSQRDRRVGAWEKGTESAAGALQKAKKAYSHRISKEPVLSKVPVECRIQQGISYLDAVKGAHQRVESFISVPKSVISNNSKWYPTVWWARCNGMELFLQSKAFMKSMVSRW